MTARADARRRAVVKSAPSHPRYPSKILHMSGLRKTPIGPRAPIRPGSALGDMARKAGARLEDMEGRRPWNKARTPLQSPTLRSTSLTARRVIRHSTESPAFAFAFAYAPPRQ